jgi:hypothetical protein
MSLKELKSIHRLLLLTGIVLLALAVKFRWLGDDGHAWRETIYGDGKGYYYYLPATFIDHDIAQDALPGEPPENFLNPVDGKLVNKFYSGTAVAMSPFFFAAWGASKAFLSSIDSYSIFFQCSVSIAALFYLLIGLLFTAKLMLTFGIGARNIMLALLLITFGTNLSYYTVYEPAMSHVYSFAFIAIFLYHARRISAEGHAVSIVWALAALGMVVLIRPVNILIIAALPFIAGSWPALRDSFSFVFRNKSKLLSGLLIFACIISIQSVFYYLQTGKLWVYAYGDAHFDFSDPHTIAFLFGYKKGLFVYTPLLLLCVAGGFILWKHERFRTYGILIFFALLLFILSSWQNWYYGDSFGMRPVIEYYSLFAVLIALVFQHLQKKIARNIFIILCSLAFILNIVQSYQYIKGIIHPDSMNKEKYWYIFMRTGKEYYDAVSGTDEMHYKKLEEKPARTYTIPPISFQSTDTMVHVITLCDEQLFKNDESFYVKASFKRKDLETRASAQATLLVKCIDQKGAAYFWKDFRLNELVRNEYAHWENVDLSFHLPQRRNSNDAVSFFIHNPQQKKFIIDSLSISVYRFRN